MRKKIVAGNWKMNKTLNEGIALFKEIVEKSEKSKHAADLVLVGPSFIHLPILAQIKDKPDNFFLVAQNCSSRASGALTGEVAAAMIKSAGVDYVIIGHSERRQYFNETYEVLREKINMALNEDLKPVFCCGESLKERESNKHLEVVANQVASSLFHLDAGDFSKLIIAYEPVWAIGTGLTASAEQAQDMHFHIRKTIRNQYGDETANSLSILYGGSCNPSNAKELFEMPDLDGGLIGGASLKAGDFLSIINSF